MSQGERQRLTRVVEEFRAVRRLGEEHIVARPNDEIVYEALRNLEGTYQIRLYAVFEDVLRARSGLGTGASLSNHVERLAAAGTSPHDLDGIGRPLEWRIVLTRDRNHLAHGRPGPPSGR